MLDDLKSKGNIAKVYYCPHHPNGKIKEYRIDCDCRKPRLGLYEEAIREFDIDLEQSYAIGDKVRDTALCEKCCCHGYLISDLEKESVIDNVKSGKYRNVRYAVDLLAASKEIVGGK